MPRLAHETPATGRRASLLPRYLPHRNHHNRHRDALERKQPLVFRRIFFDMCKAK